MPTFSEKGHAKNIANFQSLISFIEGYGTVYNPSKITLKLPALNTLLADAQTKLAEVLKTNVDYNNAVNDRMIEFSNLKSLATRIINALQVTDATPEIIKDAKTFNRKLQGRRASKPEKQTTPDTPVPNTISSSQQSYDQQVQYFAGLVALLKTEASYTPNETDLTVAGLTTKQMNLAAKNLVVVARYTTVSNKRIARNNVLYNPQTGLVQTALDAKKYIKSVFGSTSAEFNQVKGIPFNTIKI